MKVLVVEDDPAVSEPLLAGLARNGIDTEHVVYASQVVAAASGVDVVLLDLGLPDGDGIDVLRELRRVSDVPVIIATARGDETDRIVGLELGADDYVVKPFGMRELVARIRAVTRRAGAARDDSPDRREHGPLVLDMRTRRVMVDGDEVELTPKEFDVLAFLMAEPGTALTRQRILESVWDSHWYGPTKTLDVHIASVGRKLGHPEWIETVRGVGFRFEPPA